MAGTLSQMIFYFVNIKVKYERIKNDEEKSKRSVSLGVYSIINSVIWAVVAALAVWGLIFFIEFLDSSFIIGIVMVILCAVVALISIPYLVFGSVLYSIYQLKLNKHPIGYIAMGVWVLAIAAGVVMVLFLGGLM